MLTKTSTKCDAFVVRGREKEERTLVFCPDRNVPFVIYEAGITPSSPKYYIMRKNSAHWALIHITQGRGTLEYNGTRYELGPRDTFLIAAGSNNSYCASQEDPFRLVWVNFFCDWMDYYLQCLGLKDTPLFHGVNCEEQLLELIRIVRETPNNNRICFSAMRIIQNILLDLSEKSFIESRVSNVSPLAMRIKSLLDSSVFEKLDMETLAAKCFVSKSSVYREFEKYYGESPYAYILRNKIESAKHLLVHNELTVAEIAAKLSFTDEFYFSNLFKKKTGISPSVYRRQMLASKD